MRGRLKENIRKHSLRLPFAVAGRSICYGDTNIELAAELTYANFGQDHAVDHTSGRYGNYMDNSYDSYAPDSKDKKKRCDHGSSTDCRCDFMQCNFKKSDCESAAIRCQHSSTVISCKTERFFFSIWTHSSVVCQCDSSLSGRREKTVETSPCAGNSNRIFQNVPVCTLSDRHSRWSYLWKFKCMDWIPV